MILINFSAGKKWRCRQKKQTCGPSQTGEGGQIDKVVLTYIHYHV